VVASSDLSHYHPYEVAQKLDRSAIDAILDLDVERFRHEEACGKWPILTLMLLAKQKGWQATLLDYRNSGDTAGSKAQVVGYAAIAFHRPAPGQARGG
jgi:AmmeMemoRadiSam system protein B